MVRLKEQYEQAVQFRKRGFTYSEIAKIVGVSKSTVSLWLAKKAFSKKVREENTARAARDNVKRIALVNKARNAERKARYQEAVRSAETEFRHYKKDPLFVAGLTCYLCEGDLKDQSRIRISSSRTASHKIFIRFAQAYLGVEHSSVRFWLLLPHRTHEEKHMRSWSRQIGLSVASFHKTQFMQGNNGNTRALQVGTGNTIIGSTVLKKKLLRWIELLPKTLQ